MKLLSPLAICAVLASQSSWAQESSIDQQADNYDNVEEIVVTGQLSRYGATKSAIPILETARSISVEMESQFRDKGALTLDDTLNYTSGVIGDTYGFSTRGDFPKVRGFDAAEYRDGQQVLFGFYNNTRSDVFMLEQVEILKGPASVLYGKGTPGGIVNAISKLAGPEKENEVIADVGTNSRYQGAADINFALSDNWFVRFVGLVRDSGTQIDFVKDDAIIVMPSITYQNETTSLTAMVEISDRDSDTAHQFLPINATACADGKAEITPATTCVNASEKPIQASTYVGEPGFNRYDTNSVLVSLLGFHEFSDSFSIEGIARYKDGKSDYRQAWHNFNGAGVPRIDADGNGSRTFYHSEASSEQFAADLRARWAFNTGALEHEIVVGAAYQNVKTDNDFLYLRDQDVLNVFNPTFGTIPVAFNGSTPLFDGPLTTTNDYGLYINDQISLGALKVNVGLRYDDNKSQATGGEAQKDSATSFSAGLLYAFESGISPYVSFAESFEPVIGLDGFTNQTLKPREGRQIEAGIKYQPPGTRTYITIAYFDIEESNLPNPATLIGQPGSQQEGVGKAKGIEFEALTTIGDWSLEGNLSFLDTETPNGVAFSSIPENQASAWVQYQPSEGSFAGFKIGGGLRYAGKNESHGVGALGPVSVKTDGYVLGDLMLGYETEKWDFTINLRNITDVKYYGTCLARGDCFPGEERSIVARVAHRF